MLVAQITDIHLGFEPDNPDELNRRRLDRALDTLARLPRRPDILFATGDLADRGDVESYRRLRSALSTCPIPVWPLPGNHDDRANFLSVFSDIPTADGFVQYVVDSGPVRFLVLDTLEEGRHGGAFCEIRAAWLKARLAEAPDRPTMIVLHHPPIETGIDWMTAHPEEPWVLRLADAMKGHTQIVAIICGHIHRPIATRWAGRPLTVCPSTAPQVALTLSPIDPEVPDGRPLIVADAPGFALHLWTGSAFVSHFDGAGSHDVLATFDARMQPLVRHLMTERSSA